MWENTTPCTELPRDFYAEIGPLQLGVVLLVHSFMLSTFFFKLDPLTDIINRLRSLERRQRIRQRSRDREMRRTLSYDAPPFYMPAEPSSSSSNPETSETGTEAISQYRRQLGERLYPKVRALRPVSVSHTILFSFDIFSSRIF